MYDLTFSFYRLDVHFILKSLHHEKNNFDLNYT